MEKKNRQKDTTVHKVPPSPTKSKERAMETKRIDTMHIINPIQVYITLEYDTKNIRNSLSIEVAKVILSCYTDRVKC